MTITEPVHPQRPHRSATVDADHCGRHDRRNGILAGLAAGALWGLVFITPRMAVGFSGTDITAGRFAVYGLIACASMFASRLSSRFSSRFSSRSSSRSSSRNSLRRPSLNEAIVVLLLSVLGFSGYYLLLVLAIGDAGVQVPALIIGTIPLLLMLIGKPRALQWRTLGPGIAATTAGLLLMAFASSALIRIDLNAAPDLPRGMALAAAAMACWTAFALINARWLKRHPHIDARQWADWIGVATALGSALIWSAGRVFADRAATATASTASGSSAAAFIAMCIATGFGSAWLATILWNIAARRLPTSLCGQLILSETLFALLYSFASDRTWPSGMQLAACALFTAGMLWSLRAHAHD